MANAGLKIEVIDLALDRSDGFIEILMKASNGSCFASQQFYEKSARLKEFGIQLKDFPSTVNSRIRFEAGGVDKIWATHLVLEVFCYEPTGKAAIRVIMNTHFNEPYYTKSEFFIQSYPSALNRLGEILCNWVPKEISVIEWNAEML